MVFNVTSQITTGCNAVRVPTVVKMTSCFPGDGGFGFGWAGGGYLARSQSGQMMLSLCSRNPLPTRLSEHL